ncbi:hypothetical protein QE152_g22501 [Popillia japonica]|uniref:Uncharacterized protein n=1 Tax=Popillia japonica TaxID=7064 RepID=A0AAW1KK27_POPJA
MEELKRLILSTSADLKKEIKNNFDQTAKINEDLKNLREEMRVKNNFDQTAKINEDLKNLREEMRVREVEMRKEKELWNQEKNELTERVKRLEEKLEHQEKKTKRNNIVIAGMNIDEKLNTKQMVEEYIKKELDLSPSIVDAYAIGKRPIIVVKLDKWEDKLSIMKSKNKLKGKNVYIDNDYTRNESAAQAAIRKRAREERQNGNQVKVAYRKIMINGQWYKWDNDKNNLQADTKN